MQIERRPISAPLEQPQSIHGENEIRRRTGGSSVWIDPVVQQNVFAAYIEHEPRPLASVVEESHPRPLEYSPVSDKLPSEFAHATHSAIPPRASSQRSGLGKVRPRYTRVTAKLPEPEEDDVTRIPTLPPPALWQYSSPGFAAESSLSSLSLIEQPAPPVFNDVSSLPTRIMPNQVPDIEEIATQPPMIVAGRPQEIAPTMTCDGPSSIVGVIPCGCPVSSNRSQPLASGTLPSDRLPSDTLRSWTAGEGANSYYAKYIAGWGKFRSPHRTLSLGLTERLRWWLLYPGRIEFLCWFGGTLLLMAVTCVFLFVSLVSMGWISMAHTNISSSTAQQQCVSGQHCRTSAVVTINPHLMLMTRTQIVPGLSVRVQGQGFSHNGRVVLTHDHGLACEPASIQTNAQGNFTLELSIGTDWAIGRHMLQAYDTQSKQQVNLSLLLVATSTSNAANPSSTVPPLPPAITATAPSGIGSGLAPTPIGQTPIAVTPTAGMTPTPAPATPTPKPLTPTPTPKPLTPTPTVKASTPAVTPTATTRGIVAQSLATQNDGMPAETSSLPLLLLAIFGYAAAMLLLVLAGLLHYRNRARHHK